MRALLAAAPQVAVFAVLAVLVGRVATGSLDLAGPGVGPDTRQRWQLVAAAALVVVVCAALMSLVTVVLASADLRARRRWVAGTVVEVTSRRGRHHVAIDDGGNGPIRALAVSASRASEVRPGDQVRTPVSPSLEHAGRFRSLR